MINLIIHHLHLGLPSPNDLLSSSFPINNLHAFLFYPICVTCIAHLILKLIILIILGLVMQCPPPLSLHPSSVHIFFSAVFKADATPTCFSWTYLMAYSKAKLESSGDKASHCFRPFWIGQLSHKCLPIQTSLYLSFKHILISLSSFMATPNSIRILHNTTIPDKIIDLLGVYG
jgi:hypothetical protein